MKAPARPPIAPAPTTVTFIPEPPPRWQGRPTGSLDCWRGRTGLEEARRLRLAQAFPNPAHAVIAGPVGGDERPAERVRGHAQATLDPGRLAHGHRVKVPGDG